VTKHLCVSDWDAEHCDWDVPSALLIKALCIFIVISGQTAVCIIPGAGFTAEANAEDRWHSDTRNAFIKFNPGSMERVTGEPKDVLFIGHKYKQSNSPFMLAAHREGIYRWHCKSFTSAFTTTQRDNHIHRLSVGDHDRRIQSSQRIERKARYIDHENLYLNFHLDVEALP
jgi:hypothetical protein